MGLGKRQPPAKRRPRIQDAPPRIIADPIPPSQRHRPAENTLFQDLAAAAEHRRRRIPRRGTLLLSIQEFYPHRTTLLSTRAGVMLARGTPTNREDEGRIDDSFILPTVSIHTR